MNTSTSQPRHFGFLLIPGYALMSVASAVDPLRAANLLGRAGHYRMSFVTAEGGWAPTSVAACGFQTVPMAEVEADFDILFVVAGGDPLSFRDPRVSAWLRRAARAGTPLGGISGGAAILAAAGVMSERRYTVHWLHLDEMRETYPDALVERRLFVIDRDRYTCAGGMAPLDMMHALITADHGIELARSVSDWLIHTGIRQAEAPQQLDPVQRYDVHHPALAAMIQLISSHIADPITLADLATLCGVSARQLVRLSRQHLGETPMSFYRKVRMAKAAEMLNQTSMSIETVAVATGFTNRSHFSRMFKQQFGKGPAALRRAV